MQGLILEKKNWLELERVKGHFDIVIFIILNITQWINYYTNNNNVFETFLEKK